MMLWKEQSAGYMLVMLIFLFSFLPCIYKRFCWSLGSYLHPPPPFSIVCFVRFDCQLKTKKTKKIKACNHHRSKKEEKNVTGKNNTVTKMCNHH